jgi:DNA-binding response OmpR family regulator
MTILLVEDDPDSNRAITKLLQKAGFEVHHFSSAAEVLKFLKTDTSIDAVVSDVHLSDMSGFLLLPLYHLNYGKEKPIIVTSGDTSEQNRKYARGTNTYFMAKPLDYVALIDKLNELTKV